MFLEVSVLAEMLECHNSGSFMAAAGATSFMTRPLNVQNTSILLAHFPSTATLRAASDIMSFLLVFVFPNCM